jgi:predicted transcriptional regulator
VAYLFIGLGVLQFVFGGFFNGLWLAFIGLYLNGAARASYQQVRMRDALSGVKARNLALETCAPISSDLQLDRLVDDQILAQGQRCFVVTDSDDTQGLLTLEKIKAVARNRREGLTVGEVMTPVSALLPADADEDLWSLVQRMNEEGVSEVPVADDGRLLGLLTQESLLNHLRLRSELAA